jgi:hypothetical protein
MNQEHMQLIGNILGDVDRLIKSERSSWDGTIQMGRSLRTARVRLEFLGTFGSFGRSAKHSE